MPRDQSVDIIEGYSIGHYASPSTSIIHSSHQCFARASLMNATALISNLSFHYLLFLKTFFKCQCPQSTYFLLKVIFFRMKSFPFLSLSHSISFKINAPVFIPSVCFYFDDTRTKISTNCLFHQEFMAYSIVLGNHFSPGIFQEVVDNELPNIRRGNITNLALSI